MRKALTLQEQKLFELFANFDYKLPKDPELILYDFYFLTSFGEEISGRNMNANYAIKEASDEVVDQLYFHMKDAVFFAVCAEIRHIFDYYDLGGIDHKISKEQYLFVQEYFKEFSMLNGISKKADLLGLDNLIAATRRDRKILTNEDSKIRLASYRAVKAVMKRMNWSRSKFAIFAEDVFNSRGWSPSYGGESWAAIAEALYRLERAGKKQEKIIWIDHAYDLQHNTDTVFNKLKLYYKNGGYSWIRRALDWKRDVAEIKDFYKKVSPQLKPLVAYVSKAVTGKSIISDEDEEERKNNSKISNDNTSESNIDIRKNNSAGYKFKIGDIVKINSTKNPFIAIDNEITKWGLENAITFGKIDDLDLTDDFKIIAIGEHPKFPGIVVAIIQPSGSHISYLVNTEGIIKKESVLKLGTQMHSQEDFKYKIGDKVFISDTDEVFPMFTSWASEHGFSIVKNKVPDSEHHFIVIARDSIGAEIGYGIQDKKTGQDYIIGEEGLKLVSTNSNSVVGSTFEVGDIVNVINNEYVYLDASNWAEKHNFKIIPGSLLNVPPFQNFKVIATGVMGIDKHPVYGIKDLKTDQNYVIRPEGLKLSDSIPTDDEVIRVSGDSYIDISNYSPFWDNVKLRQSNLSYFENNMNKFIWLQNAVIEDARLKLSINKKIVFESGVWHSGTWKEGIFAGGIWESGKWIDGTWNRDAQWQSGEILNIDGVYEYSSEPPE